jgi:hypothetical protein
VGGGGNVHQLRQPTLNNSLFCGVLAILAPQVAARGPQRSLAL